MDKIFDGMCPDCRSNMIKKLFFRKRNSEEQAMLERLRSVTFGMSDGCTFASLQDAYVEKARR